MQRSQDTLYPLIADLRTKAQFTKEITKRYKTYGELLDKDTIALLLVDELGRNTFSLTKINDLKPDTDATVTATVHNISDVKTFRKKNGTTGKVLNLDITDDTGTCHLVLWNDDIQQVKSKDIKPGTHIRIINGYTKTSYTGLELNLGKWGMLDIDDTPTQPPPATTDSTNHSLSGILHSRETTKAFFKDNGDFGFVTTINIQTSDGTTQPVTLWDASVKAIQDIHLGEAITLRRVEKKTVNGTNEWHLNDAGSVERTTPHPTIKATAQEKPYASRSSATPR
jgi:replication factor A1